MRANYAADRAKYTAGWKSGLPETRCGAGSTVEATIQHRKFLARAAIEHKIRTVVDVGAGDLNWTPLIPWSVDYQPLDFVPRHPLVKKFDLVAEVPPACDLVMCIWVINHLHPGDMLKAWQNLTATDARWLVYTWDCRLPPFMNPPAVDQMQIDPPRLAEPGSPGHGGVFLRLVELPVC